MLLVQLLLSNLKGKNIINFIYLLYLFSKIELYIKRIFYEYYSYIPTIIIHIKSKVNVLNRPSTKIHNEIILNYSKIRKLFYFPLI